MVRLLNRSAPAPRRRLLWYVLGATCLAMGCYMGAQLERIYTLHGSPPPSLPAPSPPSPPPPYPPPGTTNTVQAPAPASTAGMEKSDAVRMVAQERVREAGLQLAEAEELAMGLARFNLKPQRGLVAITFGDEKMGPHLLNWVWHLRGTRIPHIVGALDDGMLKLLEDNGVPSYPFFHKGLDGSNQHSSDSWKKFAIGRMSQVRVLLKLGYDALMTDIDVGWLKNPTPYLYCTGEPLQPEVDCSSMAYADVAVSSDNLSPRLDWKGGASYPIWGTFNTGIVFMRATPAGILFADAWFHNLAEAPGRYAPLTSDQQVFNMMMREPQKWPGVTVFDRSKPMGRLVEAHEPRLPDGRPVKVGILPIALFSNGHAFFVQRHDIHMKLQPYAVHATYTFDGAGSMAKQHRFRERGLWYEDEAYVHAAHRFLTYDASVPPELHGPVGLSTHLPVVEYHLQSLRGALAVARALNRTLLLPELPCYCDKTWGGHDNIFKSQCMYPGAQDGNYLSELKCPMDHLLSPTTWYTAGIDFRPAGFLYGHYSQRVPAEIRHAPVKSVEVVPRSQFTSAADGAEKARVPQGATDVELRQALAAVDTVPVLSVRDVRHAFCRFEDAEENSAFQRLVERVMQPIPWCSECHPEGCAHYVADGTLKSGVINPTRGGQHQMFCKEFSVPQPLCG